MCSALFGLQRLIVRTESAGSDGARAPKGAFVV